MRGWICIYLVLSWFYAIKTVLKDWALAENESPRLNDVSTEPWEVPPISVYAPLSTWIIAVLGYTPNPIWLHLIWRNRLRLGSVRKFDPTNTRTAPVSLREMRCQLSTFHQRVYFRQQMHHYPCGAATPFFFPAIFGQFSSWREPFVWPLWDTVTYEIFRNEACDLWPYELKEIEQWFNPLVFTVNFPPNGRWNAHWWQFAIVLDSLHSHPM
jgi:hypothetical protein